MPLILEGIRLSLVINVGTATIGSTVAAKGLGEVIIAGLLSNNTAFVLQGGLVTGLMAVLLYDAMRMFERQVLRRRLLAVTTAIIAGTDIPDGDIRIPNAARQRAPVSSSATGSAGGRMADAAADARDLWRLACGHARLRPLAAVGARARRGVLLTLHSSLQHEIAHGHPTRWPRFNRLLAIVPLSLWLPYARYQQMHLAHHHDDRLTDPIDDPESFYLTPECGRG